MKSKKQLWLLAGGNGAGKSTFYRTSALGKHRVPFANADLVSQHIDPNDPEAASYAAAHLVEQMRYRLLENGTSFCFETVYSHPSKIDFVAEAKAKGYQVILVYVHLNTPELNIARVRQRVSEGGHNVPPDKIRSRIPRLMKNIATTLHLVDEARLFNNSEHDRPYRQVALIRRGKRVETINSLPAWADVLLASIP